MPTGESPDDLALADALRPPPSAIPLTSDVLSFVSSHTSRRPISPSHPIIQTATQQNKRAKTPNPVGLLPSRPRLPFRAPSPEVGPPSRQRLGLRAACRRFHPPRRPASLRFVLAIRTLQSARFQVPSSAFRLPRSPIFHLRPPSPPHFSMRRRETGCQKVPESAKRCQKVPSGTEHPSSSPPPYETNDRKPKPGGVPHAGPSRPRQSGSGVPPLFRLSPSRLPRSEFRVQMSRPRLPFRVPNWHHRRASVLDCVRLAAAFIPSSELRVPTSASPISGLMPPTPTSLLCARSLTSEWKRFERKAKKG
jgi:hypothetical protein